MTRSALSITHLSPALVRIEGGDGAGAPVVVRFSDGRALTTRLAPRKTEGAGVAWLVIEPPLAPGATGTATSGPEHLDFLFSAPTLEVDKHAALLRKGLRKAPDWAIDSVEVQEGRMIATGWHVRPIETPLEVLVNGVRPQTQFYSREDLSRVFSVWPDLTATAFNLTCEAPGDEDLCFTLVCPTDVHPTVSAFHYPVRSRSAAEEPSSERIRRVNGFTSLSTFRRHGFTGYRLLGEIIRAELDGRGPVRVLDWGCGCGGLGRYFLDDPGFDYVGCDIDPDNIGWCRRTLGPERFHQMPLTAPEEPLAGGGFDAVFAVSVISHLSEARIVEWSRWLARNLRPGGVLVLTTLAVQAVAREADLELVRGTFARGVAFFQDDHEIGRIIDDPGFYGTSFQTPAALAELLEDGFTLTDFKQGGYGHQDILVFRRR